jgi:hypothetical protein
MLTQLEIVNKVMPRCKKRGDCLLWLGPVHKKGLYGMVSGADRKSVAVHVAVYEHFVGPIPYNYRVVQSCGNRLCLNFEHMSLVTHGTTMLQDPARVLLENTRRVASGCLEWTGSLDDHGYGLLALMGETRAHRVSYRLHNGDIPEGMLVCHKCDNPPCCDPAHLFHGTYLDNARDCSSKGRWNDRRGEKNGKAILTTDQVLDIREKLAAGLSQLTLARIYQVKPPVIYKIAHRISWAHI